MRVAASRNASITASVLRISDNTMLIFYPEDDIFGRIGFDLILNPYEQPYERLRTERDSRTNTGRAPYERRASNGSDQKIEPRTGN